MGNVVLTQHISRATADLTVAMILNLAHGSPEADGTTVGLIGLGKVGAYMVPTLRASRMHVLYTKPRRLSAGEEQQLGVQWVSSLNEVLQRSDVVCMTCSYNPSTHKLIGERELKLMKPTAFFINTSRGRLVDEPALLRALHDGTIAGAALDEFWHDAA